MFFFLLDEYKKKKRNKEGFFHKDYFLKTKNNSALEGRTNITSPDFHAFVGDYIRQENERNIVKTECSIDKSNLSFDLGGRPCPVVEFNEKKYVEDNFSLINNSKRHTVYFYITCADTKKFELLIDPIEGKIKKVNHIVGFKELYNL